jgi:hypothetical protein
VEAPRLEPVAASPTPETPTAPAADAFVALAAPGSATPAAAPIWQNKLAIAAGVAGLVVLGGGAVFFAGTRSSTPSADPQWAVSARATAAAPAPEVAQAAAPVRTRVQPPAPPVPAPRAQAPGAVVPPAAVNTAQSPGMLQIFSRIPLELYENGRKIGTTDDGQVVVTQGRHQIELVNRRFNYRGAITLEVDAGQLTSHTVSLPSGRLRVSAAAGSEVWVEGEHVGAIPVGELVVPIGTREVVVRHPQLGERRQSVEVALGTPAEVSFPLEAAANAPGAPMPRLAPLSQAAGPRDAIR